MKPFLHLSALAAVTSLLSAKKPDADASLVRQVRIIRSQHAPPLA
jgi:hypothetical protein